MVPSILLQQFFLILVTNCLNYFIQEISISITEFALEGGSGCPWDYLQLDSHDTSSGRLCGTSGVGYMQVFQSPMTILLHTDGSVVDTGFFLTYEAVPVSGKPNTTIVVSFLITETYVLCD